MARMKGEIFAGDSTFISPLALLGERVTVGSNVQIWHYTQIREGASIGSNTIIGKSVYVGPDVIVGENCKIQNGVEINEPTVLESGVFLGPGTIITNDKLPRAINPDERIKGKTDWVRSKTILKLGCSVGAGSVIVSPCLVGQWSMIGAGSVVTRDVMDHSLAFGNPAKFIAWIGFTGQRLTEKQGFWVDPTTNHKFILVKEGLRYVSQ